MLEGVHIGFLILLPIVAFLYSSVGHGGASGYLALMALFAFETAFMKQTALTLNLFVAGIAFIHYFKAGHFNWRLFLWFALGSVPAAYIGGTINLDPVLYKRILGVLLRQRRHQVGLVVVEGANRTNGEVRGLTVLGFDDQAGSIKGDVDLALQSGHPQARQHLAVTLHRAGERRLRHTHLGSLGASHYEDDPDGHGLKPGWERPRCSPNHARRSSRAEPMILGLESN